MYLNARSIRNKISLLEAYVTAEDPDIIGITETWLDLDGKDVKQLYSLEGYNLFHKDRKDRGGGGVALYVRNNIGATEVKDEENLSESIAVEINCGNRNRFSLGLVYRPPRQSGDQETEMCNFITRTASNKRCIILGDFNFPNIDWVNYTGNNESNEFLDSVLENFLSQEVHEPTRENNILDLVLVTDPQIIDNLKVAEPLGESDHNMVRFEINIDIRVKENLMKILDFRKANFASIRQELQDTNWGDILRGDIDSNEKWNIFMSRVNEIQERNIPKIEKRSKNKCNPRWFNAEVRGKISDKKWAFGNLKQNNSEENLRWYREKRDDLKRTIKQSKKELERNISSNAKRNPKQFFSYYGKGKDHGNIGPLEKGNGGFTENDMEMSELLNTYFTSQFTREDVTCIPVAHRFDENIDPLQSTEMLIDDIFKKLKSLDVTKAAGPDNLYPRFLKECAQELAVPLEKIFSSTLNDGVVPEEWKKANITPIYKKGSRSRPENYRPISLTNVACKIFESLLKHRIVEYLTDNRILLDTQHGFRSGRSCLTNLLEFFEKVTSEVDNGKPIDMVYFDFSKAFDKVPHERLLKKIEAHGIKGDIQRWIKNWLSGRIQRVVLNGVKSEWSAVTSGVPQGSVLGPLLFLIYINDIDLGIQSTISKFADDTKIFNNTETLDGNIAIQKDIDKLHAWSDKWEMDFNLKKCKSLHIGHNNTKFCYRMGDEWIEQATQEKDLGIVISDDLKPTKQCIEARNKANKMLGFMSSKIEYKTKAVVMKCFNAFVRPLLEFGAPHWSPYLQQDINMLEKVQRKATRMIPGISHLSYEERLKELNLFPLKYRRMRGDMIQVFKMAKGMDGLKFQEFFELDQNTRTRGHRFKIKKFRSRLEIRKNCFSQRVVGWWNKLPDEVFDCNSVESFKLKLDKFMIGNLEVFL